MAFHGITQKNILLLFLSFFCTINSAENSRLTKFNIPENHVVSISFKNYSPDPASPYLVYLPYEVIKAFSALHPVNNNNNICLEGWRSRLDGKFPFKITELLETEISPTLGLHNIDLIYKLGTNKKFTLDLTPEQQAKVFVLTMALDPFDLNFKKTLKNKFPELKLSMHLVPQVSSLSEEDKAGFLYWFNWNWENDRNKVYDGPTIFQLWYNGKMIFENGLTTKANQPVDQEPHNRQVINPLDNQTFLKNVFFIGVLTAIIISQKNQ